MDLWERKMVDTDRGRFEVFVKGQGDPLCVTHHYSEFNDSGDYFAESFTLTHRVYLMNLREAGSSPKAEESYQLSMLETLFDLESVREALGLERWGFAGHSTGGMLGVLYGIYFSEKLNYCIIVGSAAREYMTLSPECIYNEAHPNFDLMQELIERLKSPDLMDEVRKQLSAERTKLSLYDPDRYDALFSLPIHKKMSAPRMNYFNRELHIFDVTKKLHLISTPVLVVCGKHDVQCPVSYSIEMENLIPNAKLEIFERSNHYPFLEESDKFQSVITEFLAEQ
ncbi:alpha/beta fold hydrolase [Thalassobacillus hwangdonensis]|uniref:Alpha/beta fold hydrolase n=1 Tax=Thalassobacillus hwangdonensis TaxID=546108 RepID=A0ABW3L0V3_9BACI